ncbi:MAG: EamA family transporter [Candidatus Paceibacterota bacterium]|jgi:drug/metabolite transporter (DMT)-like permease
MWVIYAFIAALLWGLDYALTEKVLNRITFSTLLSIELFFGLLGMLLLGLLRGTYWKDWSVILSSQKIIWHVVIIVLVFNIANTFIVLSIGNKNATLAGLIEISYPLFIAVFSWFLFKESHVNLWTGIGAVLVFSGIGLIYYVNK